MSSILIIGGTILVLLIAYIGYGGWLARRFGMNFRARTPAETKADNQDYVTMKASVLEGHQISGMAGPALLQGTVISAAFGWVPVVLWLVLGSVFLGAVENLAALLASVRHGGASVGMVIEKHLGKRAGKTFMLVSWIAIIILMAFFMDMALQLLPGITSGESGHTIQNGYGASVSMALLLLIPISVIFGYFNRLGCPVIVSTILGGVLIVVSLGASVYAPLYLPGNIWFVLLAICALAAAVLPVWFYLQPVGYLSSCYLYVLLLAAVAGLILVRPDMQLTPFNGWKVEDQYLFPYLFAALAASMFSGYHGLVSSGITSRTLSSEKSISKVSYAPILFQALAGVVILVLIGTQSQFGAESNPAELVQTAMWSLAQKAGVGARWQIPAEVLIGAAIAAITFSALGTASRTGRVIFQELGIIKNKFLAGICTVVAAAVLTWAGYEHLWPVAGELFLLMVIPICMACMSWLKEIGSKYKTLILPTAAAVIVSAAEGIWLIMADIRVLSDRGFEISTIPEIIRILLILFAMITAYLTIIDGGRAFMNRQKIIFATGNEGKMQEIRRIMGDLPVDILSMKEAGIQMDIEENGATFEENAMIKAASVAEEAGCLVLADDSGLEVDYLNKEPGVLSARYMGEDTPYTIKNASILEQLEGVEDAERTARFVCAIAAVFPDGRTITARETMEGHIGYEARGENGFGYDPIFYPDGYDCSSAEMDMEEKNKISHRGKALRAMRDKLV